MGFFLGNVRECFATFWRWNFPGEFVQKENALGDFLGVIIWKICLGMFVRKCREIVKEVNFPWEFVQGKC